ncbi:MAG: hypothetical protein Ct9H90mP27_6340 [Gammaproteobacteria bacterium]|nr:MAG: hypothetical protein Ct9H90mP27_6340 [Gammaproteobacteria bacterium]
MNAMNESLNMENCQFGIRACAICPGEGAHTNSDNRPIPVSEEDRSKMVQSEDWGGRHCSWLNCPLSVH